MGSERFKINSVIIDGGSGVLYQPRDITDYTYILSAKHNFYDKDKAIKKSVKISFYNDQDNEISVNIISQKNYFEHSDKLVDAVILKIDYIKNVEEIFIDEDCNAFNECHLCGYPGNLRGNKNDKYTFYNITHKIDTTHIGGYYRLQSDFGTLSHEDFLGFSGGGVFRINNGRIYLIGIQSSTPSQYANGQIDVVPLNKFKGILINESYIDFIPSFLISFDLLKEKVFDFDAGPDDDDVLYTRSFLKQKAIEAINSEVTPMFIKEYFKERLLINDKDITKLDDELIYITWLEFLTLINIVKSKTCNIEDVKEVFKFVRLLYKRTKTRWLASDFIKDCLSSNYEGLKEEGTVFIKTTTEPIKPEHYTVMKGSIVSSISAIKADYLKGKPLYNEAGVNIFNAISEKNEFIFDKFNFIHFEYLKHIMLVLNSDEYKDFNKRNQGQLLIKLKEEYGKIFGI